MFRAAIRLAHSVFRFCGGRLKAVSALCGALQKLRQGALHQVTGQVSTDVPTFSSFLCHFPSSLNWMNGVMLRSHHKDTLTPPCSTGGGQKQVCFHPHFQFVH